MVQDHVQSDEFQLSQEILAEMLAVQRPTISEVAAEMRREGLITYNYGRVRVINRAALEKATCECYGVTRAHFDRLRG